MSEFKVASRYAKALIDLSQEQTDLDTVKKDMEQFIAVLRQNKELQAVLKNPIIKQDMKTNILNGLFADKIHPSIMEFLRILVRKGRSNILYATAKEFVREYDELKGIVHATVTSAAALSPASMDALTKTIATEIGAAEVVLTNKIDESLIAGFVVKVGDRQIDASIAGKLAKLERHFTQTVI